MLNIEELATLWHFPVEANVKSPLIQKAPGRKADAPSSLPMADESTPLPADIFSGLGTGKDSISPLAETSQDKAATPPPNLPFV